MEGKMKYMTFAFNFDVVAIHESLLTNRHS